MSILYTFFNTNFCIFSLLVTQTIYSKKDSILGHPTISQIVLQELHRYYLNLRTILCYRYYYPQSTDEESEREVTFPVKNYY